MMGPGLGQVENPGSDWEPQPLVAPAEHRADGMWALVMAFTGTAGNWLERGIEGAVVLALLAELMVVFSNIVVRTLFGVNYDWVQEISEIALTFLTFVGGALAFRGGNPHRDHGPHSA